jgi:hypothetical protein
MNQINNHEISLQTAIDMTKRYRANRHANYPVCETFEIAAVTKLIATEGCASLRVYYGMKENTNVDVLLVAVNAAGEDILPPSTLVAVSTEDAIILEDGYRCPDVCPTDSPLNVD